MRVSLFKFIFELFEEFLDFGVDYYLAVGIVFVAVVEIYVIVFGLIEGCEGRYFCDNRVGVFFCVF